MTGRFSKPLRSLLLILFTVASLTSCNRETAILTLLTDKPELAVVVEAYTERHSDSPITLHYRSNIDSRIIASVGADIVIADDIHSTDILDKMIGLESPPGLYPLLLNPVQEDGEIRLLPLAFRLPSVMFLSDSMALEDPMLIRIDQLRQSARERSRSSDTGDWIRLGFSPLWDDAFLMDLLSLRSDPFSQDGYLDSDQSQLQSFPGEIRNWIDEDLGGLERAHAFDEKYRYVSDTNLLLEGRIAVQRGDFVQWLQLPESTARQMDFRYLSGPRFVNPTRLTWIGIPTASKNQDRARHFVKWFVDGETHRDMMNRWERAGLRVFGFLGGLSSFQEINETDLPIRYPVLSGLIPEADFIASPQRVPDRWNRIRTEVLIPWIQESLIENETPPLASRYQEWDRTSLDSGATEAH